MNTNNVNNINTNKMINSDTINIILFVLFIVLIILIFNLNFSEPFDNLISDPGDIVSFCNSQSPTTTFNAPSFVTLFNCNASNPYITNPTPYNIVLSPINVCPINSYLYSPTNTCFTAPYHPSLAAWYDVDCNDSNKVNLIDATHVRLNNKALDLTIGNLDTFASSTIPVSKSVYATNGIYTIDITNMYTSGTDKGKGKNNFLSVSNISLNNKFTIFIVYQLFSDPSTSVTPTNLRQSLFGTANGTTNIINMYNNYRLVGNTATNDTNLPSVPIMIGDNLDSNGSRNSRAIDDMTYITLYTACITLTQRASGSGNVITWIENVYNRSINNISATYINTNNNVTSTLGNTLYICGGPIVNRGVSTSLPTGFYGKLGEVLLYKEALTTNLNQTSQYDVIVNYLRNKWNI